LASKPRWLPITVVYTAPNSSRSGTSTALAPAASVRMLPEDSKLSKSMKPWRVGRPKLTLVTW
jgi:hypothetical protein